MKKAKILLALLLTALFVLSALGSGESSPSSDVPVEDDYVVDAYEPETEEPVEESKEVSRGIISGNVYTNDFADITITKPSDWVFANDEEIAATLNAGQAALDLNFLEEALTNAASVYDMYAYDDYGNSIMICYENTMLTAGSTITAEKYAESFVDNMESVANPSYTYVSTEDVTFGHTDYVKVVLAGNTSGIEFQQAAYITVVDNYAISIITTGATETLDSLEAFIY